MKPKRLTDTEIQSTVTSAVREAVDFVESEVAPDRIEAQKYFNGGTKVEHEEGRSSVVATKVRDTIRAIKPALMRVFLQSDKPVEFIPTTPQAVAFMGGSPQGVGNGRDRPGACRRAAARRR